MDGHHLILGELIDYLTAAVLPDTHDERHRQKIARLLIEALGYKKTEIISRRELIVATDNKRAKISIDFIVTVGEKVGMLIKYGPGSLTTRHKPVLAAARLVDNYQVPVAVVTNGEDAETLDTVSEKVIGRGIDHIPNRVQLAKIVSGYEFAPVSEKKIEMAARIVYCYEIDGACPCDTTVCHLEEGQPEPQGIYVNS